MVTSGSKSKKDRPVHGHYTVYGLACSRSLITRTVTFSRFQEQVIRVGFVVDKMTLGHVSLLQLLFFFSFAVPTDWGEMAYGIYHRCKFKSQLFKFLNRPSSFLCILSFLTQQKKYVLRENRNNQW